MTVEEAEVVVGRRVHGGRDRAVGPAPARQARDLLVALIQGLREAIYELLGPEPQTADAIAAAVREQWGEATDEQIGRALAVLRRSGEVLRVAAGYVRREA